jgi:murein DD-endopeptidase MepM/ murein hydrolase activator NlpD
MGTSLIALEDGIVGLSGCYPSYSDAALQVAHGQGCLGQPENGTFSGYLHVSYAFVRVGDAVRAGRRLSYSRASHSGVEHLHFEIREGSVWQQRAVNPIPWLDLHDAGPPTVSATWI